MNIGIDIRPLMDKIKTGVGEYTFELLNAVFSIDKTNQYFLFYNSNKNISANLPKWNYDNVHYVGLNWPNKLLSCLLFLKILKLNNLAQNHYFKIDLWFSPNLNFTNLSKNIPYILVIHDLTNELYPHFFTKRQQLRYEIIRPKTQCQRANLIITPSENTKRDLINLYDINPDKIKVIYPGLASTFVANNTQPVDLVKTKYNLPEKFILFLGTIEPRKNINGLIEAFEQSYSKLPAPHSLVIAGAPGWRNKNIYNKAQSSPLKDKIKFINYINPEDKPALYKTAALFVYPSFYEGFGFPVLEAMASRLPIITSNRSSLPEITNTQVCLINPNNPTDIAKGITSILNNTKKQPREYKIQKFSWKLAAEEWLEYIKNL
ncbi:MAG: Glycosyl transferase, group 1 [Candidatus Magasanikbacteria bacterium GW2011_GWC2_34_16]|uniref:Glycosyl transferase, group 1 n=2 Tax=Candidatus Magasanikiibacteriota TaxID=1752731 RepID=A0A0G0HRK0_9BACT|nr:MAG: Glycosyl transferase, group 1 [Candidatus Magasanikbacteria bacterium GW2011_GWC2_34_16]KKQ41230.1 MAG: Glycosyl transferase, group 1 [Candidatus Magasanikbacteria bacterium GW2011_GWA2_37_8]